MNMKCKLKNPLRNDGVQSLLASLLCILGGLALGYIVLLIIEPTGAWTAITNIVKNYMIYPSSRMQLKYLGQTLVRSAPLLMCSLSVLFAYKAGMFNIGVAGQYVAGACAALYCALSLKLPWYICMLAAMAAGAAIGALSGWLKTLCNVNVVISGIMLNWIALYLTNLILTTVQNPSSPETLQLMAINPKALLPNLGLGALFSNEKSVTLAIPLAIVASFLVWVILNKTKFGYELKATGFNYHAARYCGMKENRNIILTMIISGALAGLGAALLYQTGIETWKTSSSSIPAMGFNGIAVAFLGGLNPIGAILASYFIQHITQGGGNVDLSVYCAQISSLISSIIIFLCAFVGFFKYCMQERIRKADAAAAAKATAQKEGGDGQ